MTHDPPSDALTRLEALRDRLEAVLNDDGTTPRDLAAVSREYRLVVEKVGTMRPSSGSSALDEIASRRRARGVS